MQEFLWVEKYRPNRLEDCILPDELKNIQQFIPTKHLTYCCLVKGVGKTSGKSLLEELGLIHCSQFPHGNIDMKDELNSTMCHLVKEESMLS